VIARLVIYSGEVFRLPAECRGLRVVSGKAWVTFDGRDIVMNRGERTVLGEHGHPALVSALGRKPVILEVRGRRRSRHGGAQAVPLFSAA
jgi:hypothetical protein